MRYLHCSLLSLSSSVVRIGDGEAYRGTDFSECPQMNRVARKIHQVLLLAND
jgi:hypothetical protein